MTTFLFNRNIYESAICEAVPKAKERLWIAIADIKDMYVDAGGVTFAAIRWYECSQSDRPMKCLDWRTSREAHNALLRRHALADAV